MKHEIGQLTIDDETLVVTRFGAPVPASRKTVELLAALCQSFGEVVTKARLIERVWPNAGIDDASLWQTIYLARRLLQRHAPDVRIETHARRGYRLARMEAAGTPPAPSHAGRPRVKALIWRWPLAALLVLATLTGVAAYRSFAMRPAGPLAPATLRAYNLGQYFLRQRTAASLEKARDNFRRVVAEAPENPLGYAGLSETYVAQSREGPRNRRRLLSLAMTLGSKAVALDPRSAEARAAAAAADYVDAFPSSAVADPKRVRAVSEAFESALALDPNNAPARMYYGEFLLRLGKVGAASEQLHRAIDSDPSLGYANVLLAEVSFLRRDPSSAIRYADEGLGFGAADKWDALLTLGFSYDAIKRPSVAIQAFRQLAKYSPSMANASIAYVDAGSGRQAEARAHLRAALRTIDCDCDDFWLVVALDYVRLGDIVAGKSSFHHVLDVPHSNAVLALDPRLDGLHTLLRLPSDG